MLRCKQVAEALASGKYWELPRRKRIGLRIHVFLCLVCGPFNRFLMLFQDATRYYARYEETSPPPPELSLTDDAKTRIKQSLRKPS